MPTAAKLEKQSSTEATDSLTKAIVVLEHKVRNLEKRKRKIEIYREDQSKGQTLNSDQLSAVSKYDEVTKNLDFAQDLCKTFSTIATENVKGAKKQGRKEAVERSLQEISRVREILVIQDVLQHMGHDSVRGDFLAGLNGATKLTEQDLKYLDDLYVGVSPKRGDISEDKLLPFDDQASQAAEHFLAIVEGKQKEAFGTTYDYFKSLVTKIQASGYFDKVILHPEEVSAEEPAQINQLVEELVIKDPEPTVLEPPPGIAAKAVDMVPPAAKLDAPPGLGPVAMLLVEPYLKQPSVSELMQTVAGSFNFLQESELDIPCVEPPTSAITTQTFTNQNYPASLAPVVQQAQTPSQVSFGSVQVGEIAATIPGFTPNPPPPIPMPPSHHSSPYSAPATTDAWPSANEAEGATNEWQPNQPCTTDWNADTTGEWLPGDDGGGFITQMGARQGSNAGRNNRSSRQGSANLGSGAAVSNYHEGGPSRNNAGYQRTNETNASMNNYHQGQQNGYQHYGGGGGGNGSNSGGMGGQYRPRSHQRGSGNRNGPPSRGGGGGGSNEHNTSHGRGGRTGPGSYGGRPQNNRQ